ncbi:MAG TPA: LLM class flavin-dependent oxidoreductase [Nocardioides sp.]|nr:LLM class flavin-dependent oxidoreductase [Nocardioides sp.]
MAVPDPALVVLIGAAGSGKSTWAHDRYRRAEVVSSDDLRAVVGSGPGDLDASVDAFDLLERIVSARLARGLTTVVDTLGLDAERRVAWREAGRAAGLPTVAVLLDTPGEVCRRRNALRDRPVPAPVLADQVRRAAEVGDALAAEGWDHVEVVPGGDAPRGPVPSDGREGRSRVVGADAGHLATPTGLRVVLQLSRFPWGEEPGSWVRSMALAAAEAGFTGVAVMDHLIQIPQVDTAWQPIPEPWVTLGLVAGLDTHLALGTLCTPVTFRPAGVTAKAAATLDALSGGRAFLGIGAGWWDREHAAFGVPFPSARERLDLVERTIETCRALWAPGTKAYDGRAVTLPETTSYPRPVTDIPVIVGGNGERRTLDIAARLGDACNLPANEDVLAHKLAVLDGHLSRAGRTRDDVAVTVLDLPVIGRDREDAWSKVERLRGRTAAAAFAARTHAGTVDQHRERYARLRISASARCSSACVDSNAPTRCSTWPTSTGDQVFALQVSCARSAARSPTTHTSTSSPSRAAKNAAPSYRNRRPVGSIPSSGPVWVPDHARRAAACPSLTTSSTIWLWKSGADRRTPSR